MLNEKGVRDQLKSVREALGKLDSEREALRGIEASLAAWLDLHAKPGDPQLPLGQPPARNGAARRGMVHGSLPLADAVLRALAMQPGTALDTSEILKRARDMGAKTTSKTPEKVVEWTIYDLVKKGKASILKVGPHRYKLPMVEPH